MDMIANYWPMLAAAALIVGAWGERRATLNQHERIITKLTVTLDALNITVARLDERLSHVERRAA